MPRTNFSSLYRQRHPTNMALIGQTFSEEKIFEKSERTDVRRTKGILYAHGSGDLKRDIFSYSRLFFC